MKQFIRLALAPLLALSIVLLPMTSYAATGTQFYVGADNIEEIAVAVEESLAADASGERRLRPQDPGDRAYANPNDYLETLREALRARGANAQALARLATVAQLPAYLRSLREADAPRGRFWSACITPTGPRLRCELSAFNPGEKAWVDPMTALAMFKKDCTNPIEGPEVPGACYVFSFNYREERAVRWMEGNRSAVSVHFSSLTEEEFARVYADDCYFVADEDGRRKPESDCPTLYCPPGSQWPEVALAAAVGLPGTPPDVSIHFQLRNGQGVLSVPSWVVDDLGNVIPCVVTVPYPIAVPEYRGWRAVARFDVAVREEILSTRVSGRYPHPFVGALHY